MYKTFGRYHARHSRASCDAVNLKQLRARYHARLIEVAKVSFKFALECTERASIEQMKIYLGEK